MRLAIDIANLDGFAVHGYKWDGRRPCTSLGTDWTWLLLSRCGRFRVAPGRNHAPGTHERPLSWREVGELTSRH